MQNPKQTSIDEMFAKYGKNYRWLVVLTVMLGTTSMVLATTIVNVVIPDIMAAFQMKQDSAQWLSTGFLAAMSTTMLITSWSVNFFGHRKTYISALAVFMSMSIIGGLSNSADLVIISRVFQGAAGGLIQPLAMIIIFQVFPVQERGRAMSIYGLGVVLSPAIGPALGGLIAHYFGWRAVFFVVLPLCLLASVLAIFFLTDRNYEDERPAFDQLGLLLLIIFTLSFLNGLKSWQKTGWDSLWTVMQTATALLSFVFFTLRELSYRQPLLNMRIFSDRQFAASAIVSFAYGMGIYGSTYLVPLFVQTIFHYTPVKSGLLLLPGGLLLAGAIIIAGRLTDKYSAHFIVIAGLLSFAGSFYLFSGATSSTTFLAMACWIILGRLGLGLIIPALNAGAVQTLKPDLLNQGSGAINFVRQLGGAFGVIITSAFLEWRTNSTFTLLKLKSFAISGNIAQAVEQANYQQAHIAGFQDSFLAVALIFALALIPAWFIQQKRSVH